MILSEPDQVKLAREVAIGVRSPQEVVARFGLTNDQWERLQQHPRFRQLLDACIAEWEGPLNTVERVRVKATAMVEEWLPEAFQRAHDPDESLNAKTELMKFIGRLGGMEAKEMAQVGDGSKFSLTINIGEGQTMKIVEQKAIEG